MIFQIKEPPIIEGALCQYFLDRPCTFDSVADENSRRQIHIAILKRTAPLIERADVRNIDLNGKNIYFSKTAHQIKNAHMH